MRIISIVVVLCIAGAACYYMDLGTTLGLTKTEPLPETIAYPEDVFAVDADVNPYFRQ